jgi:hypothetical protein
MKTVEAIKHFGSVPALAKVLGCTPSAIYQWGDDVPSNRWFEIEVKSGGALKAPRKQEAAA